VDPGLIVSAGPTIVRSLRQLSRSAAKASRSISIVETFGFNAFAPNPIQATIVDASTLPAPQPPPYYPPPPDDYYGYY